ncbi:MAG: acyl-CoA carboxylase subunit beta, partial [Saprospiraceae bacterium]
MNQSFDLVFNQNEDAMKLYLSKLRKEIDTIELGGGLKKLENQRSEGKLTARERIQYLLDDQKPQFELGAFAGYEMYEEYGG